MDLLTEIRRAAVTVQRIGQVTLLRLRGGLPPGKKPETDVAEIRALADRVATRGANGSLGAHQLVELPADRPPWYDTGIDLAEGEFVTWLAGGRARVGPRAAWRGRRGRARVRGAAAERRDRRNARHELARVAGIRRATR